MFEIKNNMIRITKGDSAVINVDLKYANGTAYTMATGDKLKFTARKNPTSAVLMEVESTTTRIVLPHNQTVNLEAGDCCYDIQLTTAAGDVFTVVGMSEIYSRNLVVLPEITA